MFLAKMPSDYELPQCFGCWFKASCKFTPSVRHLFSSLLLGDTGRIHGPLLQF